METIIVSIIGACSVITTTIIQTITARKTSHIDNRFKELDKKIDKIAVGASKNFLVRTLAEIENGIQIDEALKARLYEEYDKYTNEYHQNSYIHSKWEKLRKDGKL